MPAPLIDGRSADQLLEYAAARLAAYVKWQRPGTVVEVPPVAEALLGGTLEQDVVAPGGGEVLARKGEVIDADLAERLASVEGLGKLRVALGQDPAWALLNAFARMASALVDRINKVPDKNFLAFLNLIGIEQRPPIPARVPLTFSLTPGGAAAVVPAGTQVAAQPLEGDEQPVVFETERDLTVTRTGLIEARALDPHRDRYADLRSLVADAVQAGAAATTTALFEGDRPVVRRLFLGRGDWSSLKGVKAITVRFQLEGEAAMLSALRWSYRDALGWRSDPPFAAAAPVKKNDGSWHVQLTGVPDLPLTRIDGRESAWLSAVLTTSVPHVETDPGQPLAQARLPLDAAFRESDAGLEPLPVGRPVSPFGSDTPSRTFYLACERAFSKPQARVRIAVALARPGAASSDLLLAWEFWDGAAWQQLGQSSPTDASIAPRAGSEFADQSRALTRDGEIAFRAPAGWGDGKVGGLSGVWLRVRLVAGGFGTGSAFQPPIVREATLSYEWPLSRVDTVQASVSMQQKDLAPELGFANQSAVDLTKDFLPFGEKPRLGDALYLACDEAFSLPGAKVTLTVKLSRPGEPSNRERLALAWENWDAGRRRWALLARTRGNGSVEQNPGEFTDGTRAFTQSGDVTFALPPTTGPAVFSGQRRAWIRVRLAEGDYGTDAVYKLKDAQAPSQGFILGSPPTYQPPLVGSLGIAFDFNSPFAPLDHVLSENDFRLADHGAEARTPNTPFVAFASNPEKRPAFYLGFQPPEGEAAFGNLPGTLYLSLAEVGAGSGTEQLSPEQLSRLQVDWQYLGPAGWKPLPVRDETRNLQRSGLITFTGPPDLRKATVLGVEAAWLRAVWSGGDFPAPPRARRVLLNTVWASNALTVTDEILGSSTGEPGQTFRTTKAPVLPGESIEVAEPDPPAWVRWIEKPDFYDSDARGRHYVVDRLTGSVRFGDGRRGMVPPQGRANVRASYRSGGGATGNGRTPGNVSQLKRAVPYVAGVRNEEPSGGGADAETVEAARRRGPRTLRHRDRAVAAVDFEDLALQASAEVARVRATGSGSGSGRVALHVLPRGQQARPTPSLQLLSLLRDYLTPRLSPTADLDLFGPQWQTVTVTAEVVPTTPEATAAVRTAVAARLAAYLHPVSGGRQGMGWDFGQWPQKSDFYLLLEAIPGVDHVRYLDVDPTLPPRGLFLVCSGDHVATVVGPPDPATLTTT